MLRLLIVLAQLIALVQVLRRFARPVQSPVPVVQNDDAVDVSIVVPVLNEVHRLDPCLRAVQAMPVRERRGATTT